MKIDLRSTASRSLLVLAVLSRAAVAAPSGGAIVVESYEGAPPADSAALLKPLYAELIKRGFVAQDKLVAIIDQVVSRSAGELSASQSAEAQKAVEQGYARFIDGDYGKAVELEGQALALYQGAPATLSKEPALRELEFKALVVAARSSEVLGNGEDAFRFMAEAIRTTPDRPINGAEFDPQVKALYKNVKDELTRQGPGTLEVKVDDATAVIFIDERFAGTGQVKVDNLLPGRYRVYVAEGERAGRVREVELPARGHASIDVPWQIDATLRTHTGYVGLETPRGGDTDGEIGTAIKVARAVGAKRVVVVGIRTVEDRRSIVAYSISTESQNRVFGAVQIEPVAPPPATLEKLAALLAGDKIDAAGIITKEPPRKRRVIGTRPSAMHKLKWMFAGGAILALGAGGGLIALDSKPVSGTTTTTRNEMFRDTKNVGIGVAVGGAALAVVAIYLFAADRPIDIEAAGAPGEVSIAPSISNDGLGLAVSGRF